MYHTNNKSQSQALAKTVTGKCQTFLKPFLKRLDQTLDLRLVRTLADTVTAIVRHRQSSTALLLSELGAYVMNPQHAPAGTKRLANLLHSQNWRATAIADYLLQEAQRRVTTELSQTDRRYLLCILDGSVIEKPESLAGGRTGSGYLQPVPQNCPSSAYHGAGVLSRSTVWTDRGAGTEMG